MTIIIIIAYVTNSTIHPLARLLVNNSYESDISHAKFAFASTCSNPLVDCAVVVVVVVGVAVVRLPVVFEHKQ